jgi:hypothetical protein
MRAAVVRGRDLYILDACTPVTVVVLDTNVWKLDVPIVERKCTLARPPFNLLAVAIRPTAAVSSTPIRVLQKALVVALQILLQHDAPHLTPARNQSFSGFQVSRIEANVMSQLAWLQNPRVERLCPLSVTVAACALEDSPTAIGKSHDGSAGLPHDVRHRANKTELAQANDFAIAFDGSIRTRLSQVRHRHGAKGADCSQGPDFGAA